MNRRLIRALLAAAVACAAVAAGAVAAKAPADHAAQAWNVLPPGQAGGVVFTKNSTDQIALYEGLTRLRENSALFRSRMTAEGFDLLPGEHPIIPVMIGDAAEAGRMADLLLEQGVYVIGFSYPVVPHGKARIRTQMSAGHTTADVNRAVDAFVAARARM